MNLEQLNADKPNVKYQHCPQCGEEREHQYFRVGIMGRPRSIGGEDCNCVFCEFDNAAKSVDKIQHYINNHAPAGIPLQSSCCACQSLTWWVSAVRKNGRNYCLNCAKVKDEEDTALAQERKENGIDLTNLFAEAT